MSLRVGTRGSRLARAQARLVCAALRDAGHETVEVIVETRGDRDQQSAFPEFGGPGVFVRELEHALLDGQIDLAVHSYKDLPSDGPEGAVIAAVPERANPADVLLARADAVDETAGRLPLRPGARVGTGSSRREALLLSARPDLRPQPIRGNIDTRIRRLAEGRFDAIVLAAAGLERLAAAGHAPDELADLRLHQLDPEWFIPAPAQGAIAVQARRADGATRDAARAIHDRSVGEPVAAERRLLELVLGNCSIPFGAWCRGSAAGGFELLCCLSVAGELRVERLRGKDPLRLAEAAAGRLQDPVEATT